MDRNQLHKLNEERYAEEQRQGIVLFIAVAVACFIAAVIMWAATR